MKLTVNLKTGVSYQIQNVTDISHNQMAPNAIYVSNERCEHVADGTESSITFIDETSLYMDEITSIVVEN